MELVRRLQAYEQFKEIASRLDELARVERDTFPVTVHRDVVLIEKIWPDLELSALVAVMQNLMKRQQHLTSHQIERELLSVRERMTSVLNYLQQKRVADFTHLLSINEGRMGLVVTFLAILELARQSLLTITQATPYSRIHLQAN
jgi:segregation and condensation protein A